MAPAPLRTTGGRLESTAALRDKRRRAARTIDWERSTLPDGVGDEFSRLAAAASSPIDDHRATAAYRRHAVAVLARRLLTRAFT